MSGQSRRGAHLYPETKPKFVEKRRDLRFEIKVHQVEPFELPIERGLAGPPLFSAPHLCTDAMGVLVQAAKRCGTSHVFVVAVPEHHVLFGYTPKHNAAAVDELLEGYEGTLVADAHAVFDHLFNDGKLVEAAGCWAYARRYLFQVAQL